MTIKKICKEQPGNFEFNSSNLEKAKKIMHRSDGAPNKDVKNPEGDKDGKSNEYQGIRLLTVYI